MPAKKKQTVQQLIADLKTQQATVAEEKNEEPVSMEEYKEFMEQEFTYGKYKGKTYGEICPTDPRYAGWFFGPKNEYVSQRARDMYARILQ